MELNVNNPMKYGEPKITLRTTILRWVELYRAIGKLSKVYRFRNKPHDFGTERVVNIEHHTDLGVFR